MKLTSFQLKNYKPFNDSGQLHLGDGFNVVVGRNSSGKSALLQGISLRFGNTPHLSMRTKPTAQSAVPQRSEALFTIACTGTELRNLLFSRGERFYVPIKTGESNDPKSLSQVLGGLFGSDQMEFRVRRFGNGDIEVSSYPSFGSFPTQVNFVVEVNSDQTEFIFSGSTSGEDRQREVGALVGRHFITHLYFFHAERLSIGESPFGHNTVLSPDARNLPEVLGVLQSNTGRMNRFNKYVSEVFPTIQRVTVRPTPNNTWQIAVWMVDPFTERDDLAVSLTDCGTGVGQVLAILYVALTSSPPFARTIVIDEPNSFLHPGAAKKLLEILRAFPHLQFIISTHSPEIIRAANPNTLSRVSWFDGMSTVEQVAVDKIDSLEQVLRDVGASLSDVFGADRILWVEGPTEEICFPLIISELLERSLVGVAIAAVRDTGRLTNQRPPADLVWQIYERISEAGALMPPALAFFFDREGRSEKETEDIVRRSKGRVRFLPRRMYENYLLHASAITATLGKKMKVDLESLALRVGSWLDERAAVFLPSEMRGVKLRSLAWLREIDGASLLQRLFSDLSDGRYEFDKKRDSYELTQWLISNEPDELAELAAHIGESLK